MSVHLVALLVLLVLGAFTYVLASRAEAKELGRIAFFCALLVLLLAWADGVDIGR